ncbi:MAG: glutamine--fructose-6-phosphate transaminase (isomerizing), partial [Croceibacterium sp.]
MCGIIGIVGSEPVAQRLIDGLRRMEYRGYDSAGLCTLYERRLIRRRAEGKLINLVIEVERHPAPGSVGIAHTRWATHGAPTTSNAHPHATEEIALVHNGIIENFRPLRQELEARGRKFESETDTEVVAHLVSEQVEAGKSPQDAVKAVLPRLRGAFALAIAFRAHPERLIGARR